MNYYIIIIDNIMTTKCSLQSSCNTIPRRRGVSGVSQSLLPAPVGRQSAETPGQVSRPSSW